jgi:hypothetical protein
VRSGSNPGGVARRVATGSVAAGDGVAALVVPTVGRASAVGPTGMRTAVAVGRGGATVGGAGASVGAVVGGGGAMVGGGGAMVGGGSNVGVGSGTIGEGSTVGGGGSIVGLGAEAVAVAAASAESWAALTSALAPSRYIAVASKNRTRPREKAAAPRLLRPSYQPQP